MKILGISIARTRLSAVLWNQSLFSARPDGAVSVHCTEPYGTPDDIALLADEVKRIAGKAPLPPAVLSLPPAWTFLRRISLPVPDLPRAKKMHIAELEGNLPIEDEEILSDILPSPPGEEGTFLAIAARRSAVEKAVDAFAASGFRPYRTVTDHVSLLCAVVSSRNGFSGLVSSDQNDFVVLRVAGGAVATARQFPEETAANREDLAEELRKIRETAGNGPPAREYVVFGNPFPSLAEGGVSATPFIPPPGVGEETSVAYGAAIAPFCGKETGGFSLRTSAEDESERTRQAFRVRVASAAAAAVILCATGSIGVARWSGEKKVSRIKAEIRKEFTEAVPGVKVIVQETAQIREKVRSLSRQKKELGLDFPEPAEMLGTLSRAFPTSGTLSVREVSFDQGRLRVAGDAGSAQQVEAFREALVKAFGPEAGVKVQEAEGSARGGSVRYTILIEKGSEDRAS